MNIDELTLFGAYANEGDALVFAKQVKDPKPCVVTVYIGNFPNQAAQPVCYLVLPRKVIDILVPYDPS